MPGTAKTYYKEYLNTREGFDKFHYEVINMPRPVFTDIGFKILRQIASYLLFIHDKTSSSGNTYKDFMGIISNKLKDGEYPEIRNIPFEQKYFQYLDLTHHYETEGRMFRHYMGLAAFWGMISSLSRTKKIINFDVCRDFVSISDEKITDFVRNLGLNVDIKTNDFIKNLKGIEPIRNDANYHPTLAILKYMKQIGRDVTDFEISVLLGRIDNVQKEDVILNRALDIGRSFQTRSRNAQLQEFFNEMGWKNASSLFQYGVCQEPWFKFHTYILFLQDFGLITQNAITKNYRLTQEAEDLLGDLPASIIDLNKLISKLRLDTADSSDATMKDILIRANMDTLKALVQDKNMVRKINTYSLQHPNITAIGKKQRNQFIAELARIRENYLCQAGTTTFERPDGRNYVEAHHIIEFAKGGPDILENLLALGPTPHVQIHRGSEKAKRDMYVHLMNKGAIKYDLFKIMAEDYQCLTAEHIEFLSDNQLISTIQKEELLRIINE